MLGLETSTVARELDQRSNDGYEVTMKWLPGEDPPIQIDVVDNKEKHQFSLRVAGEMAMEAFLHPFATAAGQGVETKPKAHVL